MPTLTEVRDGASVSSGTAHALQTALDACRRSGEVLVVTGNTDDYVVSDGGQPWDVVELLREQHREQSQSCLVWQPSGLMRCDSDSASNELRQSIEGLEPRQAVQQLARAAKSAGLSVIIDFADHLLPATPTTADDPDRLAIVEALANSRSSDGVIVLVDRGNGIDERLRGRAAGFRLHQIALPTTTERRSMFAILNDRAARSVDSYARFEGDTDDLVAQSQGLRLRDLRSLATDAVGCGSVSANDVGSARERVIREVSHDLLRVHPITQTEATAGLGHLVRYLELCRRQACWPVGLLLAGPPGTGKSFSVSLIANAANSLLIALGRMHSPLVGSSEERLERALHLLESFAPAVVWLDEIDQLFPARTGGGSGDSGTSERLQARLWSFTGDARQSSGLLWVGTTNRIELLDPALRSRLGTVIPVLHPTRCDLAALVPVLAAQQGVAVTQGGVEALLADSRVGLLSVRDLSRVIGQAVLMRSEHAGAVWLGPDDMARALTDLIVMGQERDVELQALTAVAATTSAALLPWSGMSEVDPYWHLPSYLVGRVDQRGVLDREWLHDRLRRLRGVS
jgi:AAA+ superfamily predicted ATPase